MRYKENIFLYIFNISNGETIIVREEAGIITKNTFLGLADGWAKENNSDGKEVWKSLLNTFIANGLRDKKLRSKKMIFVRGNPQ